MKGGSGDEMHGEFWEMMLKKHLKQKQIQSEMQKRNTESLVDALSRHRDILRRDISFLRTEVALRELATIDGKRDYLEKTQSNIELPPLTEQMDDRYEFMASVALDSETSDVTQQKMPKSYKVSLPYLVSNNEEALDFLLHESLELNNRIQSLASITREFSIPISSVKVNLLHSLSSTLKSILRCILHSETIKSEKSIKEAFKEEKTDNNTSYDSHRACWKSRWGCGTPNCGFFDDITTLSPMQFTRYPPGVFPYYGTTGPALQIYSIKIVELNTNLDWPLCVYGVVAARDDVDHNRNILFSRPRHNCQVLTENDPFLRLTGPSRAIVAAAPVTFEVDLKIMYGVDFQDKSVLTCNYNYWSMYDDTPEIGSGCCTVQLSHEQLGTAIQATIVGVHLVEGGHPFEGGCEVFCFSCAPGKGLGDPSLRKVVLLDCRGEEMAVGSDNYMRLSRNVVTVELHGTLRICISAFSLSGASGYVDIPVQHCQTSVGEFFVGKSKVKVVVAWSLLSMDKENLMLEGYIRS